MAMIESIAKLAFMYVLTSLFIELAFPAGRRFLKYIYWSALLLTIFITVGPYIVRVADDIHNVAVTYSRGKEAVSGLIGGPTGVDVGYQDAWEKLSGNASFRLPLKSEITQEFTEGEHHGIDIVGRDGDSIKSSRPGKVSGIDEHETYGLYVIIDHGNGWESLYAHCSKVVVAKGDMILWDDKIAEVGNSGKSTGFHLHFEIRKDGKARNIKELLK